MTDAILEISDGTTTISLIHPSTGFHLISWTPAITDYKDGGTFQNPPLADWRQMRDSKWATAEEPFTITLNGAAPDSAAFRLQELRRLLEKANQYWTTDWQNTPVYIAARMRCETNTRYALVVKGRLGNDRNFYDQPVTGDTTTLTELPLVIERRAWQANAPNGYDSISIGQLYTYDGTNYGNVNDSGVFTPTTNANEVFLANKTAMPQITNVHYYDGAFTANLQGGAFPVELIPNGAGVGDILYFGIDTSIADSGIFQHIVVDLDAGTGTAEFIWEYWSGAAWSVFGADVLDNTSSFTVDGVNVIVIPPAGAWSTNTPGGALPTGYWVRARISAGSFTSNVSQQNRNIYTVNNPYIELLSTDVVGDIPAFGRMLCVPKSSIDTLVSYDATRILGGLRSVDRGSSFNAFINLSDTQLPTGVTVAVSSGCTFVSNTLLSATSKLAEHDASSNLTGQITIAFTAAIAQQYQGRFRVFCRYNTNDANQWKLQLDITNSTASFTTIFEGTQTGFLDAVVSASGFGVADLGEYITNAAQIFDDSGILRFGFKLTSTSNVGSGTLDLIDIVFIPVDEFSFDTNGDGSGTGELSTGATDWTNYLDIGSLLTSKRNLSSIVRLRSDDNFNNTWQTLNNGPFIWQANKQQRLWILSFSPSRITSYVQVYKNERYLSLRGNR